MKIHWIYLFLLGMLLIAGCGQQRSGMENSRSPNIILIVADDLGYGDLSCYGQEVLTTPHIDDLANKGIKFTNHYTGSTVCAPSRASLLTGLHTGHVSVRGNRPDMSLYEDEYTLGEVMKQGGYVTGAIGKWGVGSPPPVNDPEKNGFDFFYGYINMWHAHNFYPEFLYRNGVKEKLPGNRTLLIDGQNPWASQPEGTGVAEKKVTYVHDLFDREALDFISANRDTTFFLYLAYNVPHANNEAGHMFNDGMEVQDYGEFAGRDWPNPEKGFARMIRNLDNSVGLITAQLEELGLTEETLVIFVSDNGPHEEGNHRVDFFDSNGKLRGKKRDLYEGGIRSPFIAKWPGKIQPGLTSDHISSFWDFLPSFCDLAGIPVPGHTDGISFIPLLTGNDEIQKEHEHLYWEFYEQGGKQAVRSGDWKLIRLNVRIGEPYVELYDLSEDESEQNNLADQYPGVVENLLEIMEDSHSAIPAISLFDMETKGDTPF